MVVEGRVILLTGASRGIGLSTAHNLLSRSEHHKVVAVARTEAPLRQLADQYPTQVAILAGDLRDATIGRASVQLALSRFHRLDGVVINHAALGATGRIAELDPDKWVRTYEVNFFSVVGIVQAAIPALRASKGRLVLISSATSIKPFAALGPYGSTKTALNHLAMMMAEEEKQIVTVALWPGEVDTEMQKALRENAGRSMRAEDVARFVEGQDSGRLLAPEIPAQVIADVVLSVSKQFNGRYISWDMDALAAYRQ